MPCARAAPGRPVIIDLLCHAATGRDGYLDGRKAVAPLPGALDALCRGHCGIGWSAVISAPGQACVDSAQALVAGAGLAVTVDADWREVDFGDWDGMPIDVLDPEQLAACFDPQHEAVPPGGESWQARDARLEAALARLLASAQQVDGISLLVAQPGPVRWLLWRLTGVPFEALWGLRIAEGSRLRLDVRCGSDGAWAELVELRQSPPLPG